LSFILSASRPRVTGLSAWSRVTSLEDRGRCRRGCWRLALRRHVPDLQEAGPAAAPHRPRRSSPPASAATPATINELTSRAFIPGRHHLFQPYV